jgi:ribosomal protein S9
MATIDDLAPPEQTRSRFPEPGSPFDLLGPADWARRARANARAPSCAIRSDDVSQAREWAKQALPADIAQAALAWAQTAASLSLDVSQAGPGQVAPQLAAHAAALAKALMEELPAEPRDALGQQGSLVASNLARLPGLAGLFKRSPSSVLTLGALFCSVAERSPPLGADLFDALLAHPHPQPLACALEAGMPTIDPQEASRRVALAAEKLAQGEAWRCVEISRLSRCADCSGAAQDSTPKQREAFAQALLVACAAGCDRRCANLLCSMAAAPPQTLARACLASIQALSSLPSQALNATPSFDSPHCPYPSIQDGGAKSSKHSFGRPLGALFHRPEWSGTPQQIECARHCAHLALRLDMRGAIETCAIHGSGFHPADRDIASRRFGQAQVTLWESCSIRKAALKPDADEPAKGRPRL